MTLEDLIRQYDKEGCVILLEGKRKVAETDKARLIQLGELLARITTRVMFRSGNAEGADYYFSHGISRADKTRLQLITPYSGHRKKYNQAGQSISLDRINLAEEPEVVYQSKSNSGTKSLIDKYTSGQINRNTIKAAYIIRDTIKVLGTKDIQPASFAIFYDDLEAKMQGGTGHTMRICKQNNVPFIDQEIWYSWLKNN